MKWFPLITLALVLCTLPKSNALTVMDVNAEPVQPVPSAAADPKPIEVVMDVSADYRHIDTGPYRWLSTGTFSVAGWQSPCNAAGVYVSAGPFQLKRGSDADVLAHQPYLLETGLFGRHYFTPPKAFLRPYVTASAGGAWIFWDYRHPLASSDGVITTEYIGGAEIRGGAGILIRLTPHAQVFW